METLRIFTDAERAAKFCAEHDGVMHIACEGFGCTVYEVYYTKRTD